MFNFIKEKVKKLYSSFTKKIASLFSGKTLDDALIKELVDLLIEADTGVKTTNAIVGALTDAIKKHKIEDTAGMKEHLELIMQEMLCASKAPEHIAPILLETIA